MAWEKQDNELRKLLEQDDFLPNGEEWDAESGWKKMENSRLSENKKKSIFFIRTAIAACIIALLGLGIWVTLFNYKTGEEAQASENMAIQPKKTIKESIPISPKPKVEEQSISSPTPKEYIVTNEFINPVKKHFETAQKREKIDLPNEIPIVAANEKDPIDKINTEPLIVLKSPDTNSAKQGAEITANPTAEIAAAVPHKKKIRVIHLNQLQGGQSSSAPAFYLTKRSELSAPSYALNTTKAPEPSIQLTIILKPH